MDICDPSKMRDEALCELAQNGDGYSSQAVNELLERYKDSVRTKARGYFLLGADTEDVIQEGMIGLYRAIMSFKSECGVSFASYAALCIIRQIQTAVRKSQRQKQLPLNFYVSLYKSVKDDEENEVALMDILPDDGAPDPEQIMIEQESAQLMAQSVEKVLSPLEYRVLELFLRGQDYRSIALSIGKTPKAVDNALQRIRRKLSELFS